MICSGGHVAEGLKERLDGWHKYKSFGFISWCKNRASALCLSSQASFMAHFDHIASHGVITEPRLWRQRGGGGGGHSFGSDVISLSGLAPTRMCRKICNPTHCGLGRVQVP